MPEGAEDDATGGRRSLAAAMQLRWETSSLAFRLFLLATCWSLLALMLAGFVLLTWYRTTAEQGFETRLDLYNLNLVASIDQTADGALTGAPNLGEPRFAAFHSGWYWQVTLAQGAPLGVASPSLAGERLILPPVEEVPFDREFRRRAVLEGPAGRSIMAIERVVIFESTGDRLSFIVSGDLGDVDDEIDAFRSRLTAVFALLGVGLVTVAVAQVLVGLRPLHRLGRSLAAIREGKASHLGGPYPAEIAPLVREMNSLIDSNAKIVERARTHVGNLAHALKTPLSVLLNEARGSASPLGTLVVEQCQLMRHQLDLYLDRARMAGGSRVLGSVCEVRPVLEALRRAMQRIYEEQAIAIALECPPGLRFRGEKQDLEEMLGNLLDNACKWAKAEVAVRAAAGDGETLVIVITDDGDGLPRERRSEALQRGRRLDTSRPGSGLGLSIVAELVELYEGQLELDAAPGGGLMVRVVLPRA